MSRIRSLQVLTTLSSFLLSITLGVLLLLSSHINNVYNYLISVSAFVLAAYYLVPLLISTSWMTVGGQLLISLFHLVSGILYIVLHSTGYKRKELHVAGVVLFIVNAVFMTACFMMLVIPKCIVDIIAEDEEGKVGGVFDLRNKASDATLCNDGSKPRDSDKGEYSIENNWINQQDHAHIIPPSLSINSNLTQLQQNHRPQSQQHSNLLHSSSMNSDIDRSRNISIMNIDEEANNSNDHNEPIDNNSNVKQQMKKQRWKSIHDEKVVLANINESLLPGVLKQQQPSTQSRSQSQSQLAELMRPISSGVASEDYGNVLVGLEEIPDFTHDVNQFDINDLNKLRKISGYNILPGSSNMVNDENLYHHHHHHHEQAKDDLLLPLKEKTIENIDNLSDVVMAKRPSMLSRSFSAPSVYDSQSVAPSLYTFRKTPSTDDIQQPQEEEELPVTPVTSTHMEKALQPTTPPSRKKSIYKSQSAKTSPIKKFFQESPKRVFKSKSSYYHTSTNGHNVNHKHSSSVISNNNYSISSLRSSFSSSSRSSPKKSFISKSSTLLKLHKYSISVPNFNMNSSFNPPPHSHHHQSGSVHSDRFVFNSSRTLRVEPIDLWDVQTTNFDMDSHPLGLEDVDVDFGEESNTSKDNSNGEMAGSRISSLPSQVFGEYDKEKWMTLKTLQQQQQGRDDTILLSEQVEVL
ncbi:hypothetical protein Cantr_01038 [Candida viswanathii]|uniref:Uncharacterized protein n=1 Tax=Candida viswanathii TaxID=5486 RepID=A0A367YHY4_9ASCO|nr:hypothetical protein Cantr_01038 [Candida viswanathii]